MKRDRPTQTERQAPDGQSGEAMLQEDAEHVQREIEEYGVDALVDFYGARGQLIYYYDLGVRFPGYTLEQLRKVPRAPTSSKRWKIDKGGWRRLPLEFTQPRPGNRPDKVVEGETAGERSERYRYPETFFKVRGIKDEVRDARGYEPWWPGSERLKDAWKDFVCKHQVGKITEQEAQSPGFIMKRYVPERIRSDPRVPPICAEARPWSEVETKPEYYQREREEAGRDRLEAKYTHPPNPKSKNKEEERRKKEEVGEGLATRIDVHPHAERLFDGAERVFFVIEGIPKADAILSQDAAVFDVPAVWQFDCPEMPLFVDKYGLRDKTVIIVPDSDWADPDKSQVLHAATYCKGLLHMKLGVKNVLIAAPPGKDGEKEGVDDFLGRGGNLNELMVVRRDPSPRFKEWAVKIAHEPRHDKTRPNTGGASADAETLKALTMIAGGGKASIGESIEPEGRGEVHRWANTLAGLINVTSKSHRTNRQSVAEAIEALLHRPGLTPGTKALTKVSGSLEIEPKKRKFYRDKNGNLRSYFRKADFPEDEPPRLRIDRELWAIDSEQPETLAEAQARDRADGIVERFGDLDLSTAQLRAAMLEQDAPR
jgi:hypothetical protein